MVIDTLLPKELNKHLIAFNTHMYSNYKVSYVYFLLEHVIEIKYGINPKYIHVFKDNKKIMDITQFHIGNVTKIINLINNKI